MRLFRRCHYRLVKGRDGDRDRCVIIVAARRVGDGPFLEAVCTASVLDLTKDSQGCSVVR